MRFVIKDDNKKEKECEVELWLEGDGDSVSLCGFSNGNKRCLLVLRNGKVKRISNAEMKGIDTNSHGQIIERI